MFNLIQKVLPALGGAAYGATLAASAPLNSDIPFFNINITDPEHSDDASAINYGAIALFAATGAYIVDMVSKSTVGKREDDNSRSWGSFFSGIGCLVCNTALSVLIAGVAYPQIPVDNPIANETLAITGSVLTIGTGLYLGLKPFLNARLGQEQATNAQAARARTNSMEQAVWGQSNKPNRGRFNPSRRAENASLNDYTQLGNERDKYVSSASLNA
ncbi:MAG: hypothetical protein K0Q57_776 [Gammaproteobacteria bacterium]|jgi:hypothetical protein|nr:hypothetical protein [Gammaproteobacteria bacterium]